MLKLDFSHFCSYSFEFRKRWSLSDDGPFHLDLFDSYASFVSDGLGSFTGVFL